MDIEFVNLDDLIKDGFKRGELFAPITIPIVTIPYDTPVLISDVEVSREKMEAWVEEAKRIGRREG